METKNDENVSKIISSCVSDQNFTLCSDNVTGDCVGKANPVTSSSQLKKRRGVVYLYGFDLRLVEIEEACQNKKFGKSSGRRTSTSR